MVWLLTVVFFVITTTTTITNGRHNAVFKSVRQANLECQQYLGLGASSYDGVEGDNCEARCEQLVLRSWSDETGMVCDSYQRYFRPTCDDPDNRNRTRSCIERGLSSTMDACGRAATSARCCREELGYLEAKSPKILRMPKVLITSYLRQCAGILGVSKGEFKLYRASWYQFPAKARRLLRCLVLRLGVYRDDVGLNLDNVYLQFDKEDLGERATKESFRECADRVGSRQSEDKDRQMAQILFHCIPWDTSSRSDLFDPLPIKPQQCQRTLRTACQIQCSPQAIAELCNIPLAFLQKALDLANVNEEGLLAPSTNLKNLTPNLASECATARLSECLADCSTPGIQVICARP